MTKGHAMVRDLWRTCVHEAGHAVVYEHLGYGRTEFEVFPSQGDDWRTSHTYTGQTFLRAAVSAGDKRLIGLAGAVAEILQGDPDLRSGELPDTVVVDEVQEQIADHRLSASDAELAEGYTDDCVERVTNILLERWDRVMAEAQTAQYGELLDLWDDGQVGIPKPTLPCGHFKRLAKLRGIS